MRRFILAAAALCLAVASANAQTLSEAVDYSTNNYYGTARSIALGNAMTALGGDLGSIGINPAGSAVAPYSQFTISPGITVSSTSASFSSWAEESFGYKSGLKRKKSALPNMGLMFTFETGRDYGLKSYSMGMVSNTTSSYLGGFDSFGKNNQTSFLGSLAAGAAPYSPEQLGDRGNYFGSSIPWNYLVAYQAGMIADAIGSDGYPMMSDDGGYIYLGTTEGMDSDGVIRSLGELNQSSKVLSAGSKQDILLNFGFNFNDRFFLGFNLGMPVATYRYNEYYRESAVNPSDFRIEYNDGYSAYFDRADYEYSQTSQLSGIYAKVGVIYLAPAGFRFGAAIQTPTVMNITDRWDVYGSTSFTDSSFDTYAQPTDVNEYSYALRLPARFNIGVAQTFLNLGLISVDFEMADYSSMRYSTIDGYSDDSYFEMENDVNAHFARCAFQGRIGAEFKLLPSLALRAGYTYQTSPYCYRYDTEGYEYDSSTYLYYYDDFAARRSVLTDEVKMFKGLTQSLSAGIGYNSRGAFFADFAIRRTSYPSDIYSVYSDYIAYDGTYTPQVSYTRRLTDAVLTLGWRF